MKKIVLVEDDVIKIVENRKKLFSKKIISTEVQIPINAIAAMQKAYSDEEGTASIIIYFNEGEEYLITCDEVDDIDQVYNDIYKVRSYSNKFKIELFNIQNFNISIIED